MAEGVKTVLDKPVEINFMLHLFSAYKKELMESQTDSCPFAEMNLTFINYRLDEYRFQSIIRAIPKCEPANLSTV
jgi:hypothetical protein